MPTTGGQVIRDIALLALGAFLHTIASPPYEWAGAGWLALVPLFLVLRDKPPRTAFMVGFLYALLWCVGTGYWVYFTVATHFPLAFPFDFLFVLGSYSFFAGLYTGIVTSLSCLLMRRGSPLLCWGGVPALWVSGEFIRSDLSSGFSWGILGYTQYHHLPLIQIADITGVYGLSFLMALSSYVAAEALVSLRRRWKEGQWSNRPLWPALGLLSVGIGLVWLYGTMRLHQYHNPSTSSLTVAMVQGNVPSKQSWKRLYYERALLKYVSVSRRGIDGAQPDLVVWPEFAMSFYLDEEPVLRAQLGLFTQRVNAPLLLGTPRREESKAGRRFYNSAYLIAPGGEVLDVYDKMRLVPFTEYRPLALSAIFTHTAESPKLFTAGRRSTVFSLPKGAFGVMICYEATFPSLARRLVRGGAQFLVNISNDTRLVGDVAAVAQHFALAVFRAVENKRYLVRTATAGISGFVDPVGRPSQLSVEEEGVILGEIVPRQEITVYARYGDWFAWACVSFALVALLSTVWNPLGVRQQQ